MKLKLHKKPPDNTDSGNKIAPKPENSDTAKPDENIPDYLKTTPEKQFQKILTTHETQIQITGAVILLYSIAITAVITGRTIQTDSWILISTVIADLLLPGIAIASLWSCIQRNASSLTHYFAFAAKLSAITIIIPMIYMILNHKNTAAFTIGAQMSASGIIGAVTSTCLYMAAKAADEN